MKIGIIIYSQTGNTLSVAEKLYMNLKKKHDVTLERVKLVDTTIPRKEPFAIMEFPDVSKYDVIVFGAYTEGFRLTPVMSAYLKHIGDFSNKKIYSFVTHFFPYSWMGGNGALNEMNSIIGEHGGFVSSSYVIDMKNRKKEEQVKNLVSSISEDIDA